MRAVARRALGVLALSLLGGCQPVVSMQGDIWVPKWVEGFDLTKLHVYIDVAPDKVALANLETGGIASAPVGHESGISVHRRYHAGYEPALELSPSARNIGYHIAVYEPQAFIGLRLWIDMNDNGQLDRGDLEGLPRNRVQEAAETSFFSCGSGGAQGDDFIWRTLEK